MPASDFQIMPTWAQLLEPNFFIETKESENLIKDRQKVSSSPIYYARLIFSGLSDVNSKIIKNHFISRAANYESFLWKNTYIPDYILLQLSLTTEDLTVRWVPASLKIIALANVFDVEAIVEFMI